MLWIIVDIAEQKRLDLYYAPGVKKDRTKRNRNLNKFKNKIKKIIMREIIAGLALLATISCRTLNCRVYPESDTPDVSIGWDITDTFSIEEDAYDREYFIINGKDAEEYLRSEENSTKEYKVGDKYIFKFARDLYYVGIITYISPKGYIEVKLKDSDPQIFSREDMDRRVVDAYNKNK